MKVLILGGGISGLSAAWFLKKKEPQAQITLLEKTGRLGGWIRTEGLYERGPRTFQTGRSPALLALIRDLDLEAELIFSDPKAARRYLWRRGKLRSLFSLPLVPALIREYFVPKTDAEESIYDFACRRFNSRIAETLFDPLALGVFAGDIRKLSMSACFPKFAAWEREKGSILKGMFAEKKKAKGLFTLRGGMERLIERLREKLDIEIVFNCAVEKLEEKEVFAGGKAWRGDRIFSALPAPVIGRLLQEEFVSQSLSVVHLAYEGRVLAKKGFGYLIPSEERESLLGMIWDSCVFPEPGCGTRLTAMVRPEEKDPMRAALEAVGRHLKIGAKPVSTAAFRAEEAIPQFGLGHAQKIARFEEKAKKDHPSLVLLGNYFEGVSVEACIQRSFKKISI